MQVKKKRVKSEVKGSVSTTKGMQPFDEDTYCMYKTHKGSKYTRFYVGKRLVVYYHQDIKTLDWLGFLIVWEDAEGVQTNEVDNFRSLELFMERFENNVKFKIIAK